MSSDQIRTRYHGAIYRIMKEYGIGGSTSPPSHVVSANAGFKEVLQYTEWHVGYESRRQYGYQFMNPHYRYYCYRPVLDHRSVSGRRLANVDLGCGAGVFSWAFLDWATSQGIGYDRVDLYGLDHCQAMIDLAETLKNELSQEVTSYPDLHYCNDVDALLYQLTRYHSGGTDYTITLGHVLVQAHDDQDVRTFTRVIDRIIRLMDAQSSCALIAVDALGLGTDFATGWDKLLVSLKGSGIRSELESVPFTGAKFAWLDSES